MPKTDYADKKIHKTTESSYMKQKRLNKIIQNV